MSIISKSAPAATISQAASALLQFKGKPLSMVDYEPFTYIYNCSPSVLVIKAGRQVGKSLGLAAILLTNSAMRNYFSSLYVAPLSQQTSRFSGAYLDTFLYSPLLRKYFLAADSKRNVFEKSLRNGSRIYLSYASDESDADRIRGVTSDLLLVDEVQDVALEALPVLRETMAASEFNFLRLTGTAKTQQGSLETVWRRTNMAEWVVKCPHCNRHTIPIDYDVCLKIMQGIDGPACVHCGKPLDMRTGTWMAAIPERKDSIGFHLPQLILSARTKPKKWQELKDKVATYSPQKLSNEVFGLSTDVGGRILSMRECMACCNPARTSWDTGFPVDDRHILYTVLGVDWSVSGSTNSYTVISVFGYDSNGKAYLLFCERLNGIDIIDQVHRVEYLYRKFKCAVMTSDRGVGVLQAQLLQRSLGHDNVHMVQYVSAKHALRWDRDGDFFSADRTRSMDTMVMKIKIGISKFETPAWSVVSSFFEDCLHVFEEESLAGKRLYRKDESACDDSLHAWVFTNLAFNILKQEFTYLDTPAGGEENFLSFN